VSEKLTPEGIAGDAFPGPGLEELRRIFTARIRAYGEQEREHGQWEEREADDAE
jgi:hypothetical protein